MDKQFKKGDKVVFTKEFSDGYNEFSKGEQVFVTGVLSNGKFVRVSDKGPDYCATDSAVPFKMSTVPVEYLEMVN